MQVATKSSPSAIMSIICIAAILRLRRDAKDEERCAALVLSRESNMASQDRHVCF